MSIPLSIALIEDHASLREATEVVLLQEGYRVFSMACAEDFDDVVGGEPIDIFVVDLNLPGEDGISLATRLRKAQPKAGIVMVTARGSQEQVEEGFQCGADIYLIKPVATGTLLASLRSFVRRMDGRKTIIPAFNLDSELKILKGPEGSVTLSPSEQAILIALTRAPHSRLETFQISELVGQTEKDYNKASLEIRITRLRKKLISIGASSKCLQAIRLVGYQLSLPIAIDG
jgi:DNA-binding response OmpR family regulator